MSNILEKRLSERIKRKRETKKKVRITKQHNEVFTCTICSKEFANKSNLYAHEQTHTRDKPYACELCSYRGITRKYLSRHEKKVHMPPTKYKCETCGKMFHYHCQLKYHTLVHTGERPYKCNVCGKAFNSTYTLSTHKYIHTNEKPYQCVFCEYACRDSSTLRKHQDRHMGLEKLYQCKVCEKRCKSKRQLKHHVAEKHLNLDIKKHACPHCVKRFIDKGTLTAHIKEVHEKAKARPCEICGVMISNKWNLTQHMRTHVDARPYKCNYQGCQTAFKDPSSLAKHVRRHKGLLYPNRLTCDECGTSFRNKTSLINHIRTVHDRKRPRYICDICNFVTHKKKRMIKHIKYGHISEMETVCRICKREFREHEFLKIHYYKLHGVKFTDKPQPLLCIKEELDEVSSIDLFEIEKHELFDDYELTQAVENNIETIVEQNVAVNSNTDSQNGDITETSEEAAKHIIETNRNRLKNVPESVFDTFYIDHVMKSDVGVSERKPKNDIEIDKNKEEFVRKSIKKMLVEVRRKKENRALERARQVYNERIVAAMKNVPKKEPVKIKYFKNTKLETNEEQNCGINNNHSSNEENESIKEVSLKMESLNEQESNNDEGRNKKVKFNTHQCYICFKLFETKEKLVEHCTHHFDICSNVSLTKCPLCDYVTKTGLTRHMRLKHDVYIKLPYSNLKDRNDNTNGSRYYYEINDAAINKIEVIPSVNNLNKMASLKIDKRRRELKDRVVAKTRLVKKGGNWLVERKTVDVNVEGVIVPKFDSSVKVTPPRNKEKDSAVNVKVSGRKNVKNDKVTDETSEYLEGMRQLYHASKKNGKKIMFPCKSCDKICQSLAALKLHLRKHDPNAKPFKPKIWKHKLEKLGIESVSEKRRTLKPNLVHRTEKPKPIVNRHNCDPELIKFYENNIRGGDIEFWQFLKIFNKMGRENVTDFRDLEERTDFGIHLPNGETEVTLSNVPEVNVPNVPEVNVPNVPEVNVPNIPEVNVPNVPEDTVPNTPEVNVPHIPKASETKAVRIKNNRCFKRVIRLSKKEYLRRNNIKNKLREKLAKESKNVDA